jgi:hypothetical protein
MFGDEASFWLDGSLHRTWAPVGVQPHVDTYGLRQTAHVFGALSLESRPRFRFRFAPVFNGATFLEFLKQLVRHSRRKIFLIIDNGPCHNLKPEGKLEGDEEANHAQSVLSDDRRARFRSPLDLQRLRRPACAAGRSGSEISLIHEPCVTG